jgi:hypothetical protein
LVAQAAATAQDPDHHDAADLGDCSAVCRPNAASKALGAISPIN